MEVSYAADTDDVDCDFHIKESIISSSSAIQCNEKIEETQPFSFCMCVHRRRNHGGRGGHGPRQISQGGDQAPIDV